MPTRRHTLAAILAMLLTGAMPVAMAQSTSAERPNNKVVIQVSDD